ncbi:MAG: glucuronate isomerase [Clostridia bacterium]|nr:glucuronate isomerase [Clostridia bacterium]
MKSFMDEDFLLSCDAAKTLYHQYASNMPIVDYHCHVSPKDIAQNKRFNNITEAWLGGDHYKWRLIRACGVPEKEITGSIQSDPYMVFRHYAKALALSPGNPLYHWSCLELKRYFGIDKQLDLNTCREIYEACSRILQEPDMSVRGLITRSKVQLLCTTDDPSDELQWHAQIARDISFPVKVLPAYRPDKALQIENPGFSAYIKLLGQSAGINIGGFDDLCAALENRADFFAEMGCRAADHAFVRCVCIKAPSGAIDTVFKKALRGEPVTVMEAEQYKTALMTVLARKYSAMGWVMEMHLGSLRGVNTMMTERFGSDMGFDCMGNGGVAEGAAGLLNHLQSEGALPRTVLYSVHPVDSEALVSVAGCFMADAECPGKVQIGSAWWFNDTKAGMEKQIADFAHGAPLGCFIGMLTDSRSFLSYPRHEYFRRILCNYFGSLMTNGEFRPPLESLGPMVQDICYRNAVRYFGFNL